MGRAATKPPPEEKIEPLDAAEVARLIAISRAPETSAFDRAMAGATLSRHGQFPAELSTPEAIAAAQTAYDPTQNVVASTFKPPTGKDAEKSKNFRRGKLVLEWLCDVQEEEVDWLCPGRIPSGMLTLFSGDKGSGKSTLASMLCAIVSKGSEWPGGDCGKAKRGSCIILNAEEHKNCIVKPRLRRFKADMTRVGVLDSVKLDSDDSETPFNISLDLKILEDEIVRRKDVRLIVIDSISAYLGRSGAQRGGEIRQLVMDPLNRLAERRKLSVVIINHLNKGSGTKALYRSKDAIDIANVCRVTWLVAPDPDDKSRRLWLPSNGNLGAGASALAFRVDDKGDFEWDGDPIEGLDGDQVLAREAVIAARAGKRGPAPNKRRECAAWLKKRLAGGAEIKAVLVKEAEKEGYSRSTLERSLFAIQANTLTTDGVVFYLLGDPFTNGVPK
jgi:putative DNA primase/helicase